jgi:hypothetical protein
MLGSRTPRRVWQFALLLAILSQNTAFLSAWPWTPRKADFPRASKVAKIAVSVTDMPSGVVGPAPSVQCKKQITDALRVLAQYRDGWKKVLVTPAAGRVQASFMSTDAKAFLPLCTIRMDAGWVSTDIDGYHCCRAMSSKDQKRLLKALGLDPALLERAKTPNAAA